ncbi:sigma-70 family RNA polymerase sigma factor [Ponticaulis sp.]|uniref:RNA polymerase sigma factor n=1 Tax=Ponticaulis sp. TaxID=2020902 RepID=UPI002634803A|nr:sigma-70 family RNA polymerase sigma factor [Ponticaulis sp.]MDF1680016.1 sigma-70 family RNA polymerase sigma factor [Ponticaulis sp.]
MDNSNLAALLSSCADGDRTAFSRLYRETYARLFSLTRRIIRDEDVARDVLQNAYVTIWKKAQQFDTLKGRPMTWMLVIVRNASIDEWRRLRRHYAEEVIEDTLSDSNPLPDERAERSIMRGLLEAELSRLPEQMSNVIRRYFLNNQTVAEISEELSISMNTIRSWLRRGLERLRHALPFDTAQVAAFIN